MTKTEVLCIGEVLWDSLPEGLFLGGAPFNDRPSGVRFSTIAPIPKGPDK